ncbi:Tyrosine aminotransferase [Porphyridium purpureum]|uniref:Tyrosine aminotransferase n=1 Tax=Porphyridium purpureum TaxID=35688 RepID=A0A5J4Z9A3_PORPP|nr:Tyrosine aminotransferase [Porphyridium purpureum]|eukprot:POR5838..scf295_1
MKTKSGSEPSARASRAAAAPLLGGIDEAMSRMGSMQNSASLRSLSGSVAAAGARAKPLAPAARVQDQPLARLQAGALPDPLAASDDAQSTDVSSLTESSHDERERGRMASPKGPDVDAVRKGYKRLRDAEAEAPVPHHAWKVRVSQSSLRTRNPIREVVDQIDLSQANPSKPVISLSLGDPTAHGNLQTHPNATRALIETIQSGRANGYPPMVGLPCARAAVAKAHSFSAEENCNKKPFVFDARDVVMANGCSHALQMCFQALADADCSNILIPEPGFSLYQTLCDNLGIEARGYRLDPLNDWEIDLEQLKSMIDENTVAIVYNSPGNPTGCVYSDSHVRELLAVCEQFQLPVIADEIYFNFCFSFGGSDDDERAHTPAWRSIAKLNAALNCPVPIFCLGGLSKRFLTPGWCLGWILIQDPHDYASQVRVGLEKVASLIVGPSSIVQTALPRILAEVPESWHAATARQIGEHAQVCFDALQAAPALHPCRPRGGMFMLVGIDFARLRGIADDLEFCEALFKEESVLVLPGECFQAPGYLRLTYTAPVATLKEAMSRITSFVARREISATLNGKSEPQ